MSSAYRISVSETLRRFIHAGDSVETRLEVLEILPCDEMAALLGAELEKRGFERRGAVLVKTAGAVEITVDPKTGVVVARATAEEVLDTKAEASGYAGGPPPKEGTPERAEYDQRVAAQRVELAKRAAAELEKRAENKEEELRRRATRTLERALRDVQRELDQVANRTTAEALKKRAAQLGEVREVIEGADGSLTIKVEV